MGQAHSAGAQRQEHRAGWTDDRVETLKQLWTEGLSATEIMNQMRGGLTRCAVIAKVHRLGLEKRSATTNKLIQKRNTPRQRSSLGAAGLERARARSAAALTPPDPGRSRVPEVARAPSCAAGLVFKTRRFGDDPGPLAEPEEPAGRATLISLGPRMCKWPISDPQDPAFSFCGARADGVYCATHRARAYVRADPPKATKVIARPARRFAA